MPGVQRYTFTSGDDHIFVDHALQCSYQIDKWSNP
jgi:hypothetical protein